MEEPEVKPVTNKLFYHYDYGDGWIVEMTRVQNCGDLLQNGTITVEDLAEAASTVIDKYKPVCVHKDGICLVDDVGGFGGFVDMLRRIYEPDGRDESSNPHDPYTKENTLIWARSMGWGARKVANKQML